MLGLPQDPLRRRLLAAGRALIRDRHEAGRPTTVHRLRRVLPLLVLGVAGAACGADAPADVAADPTGSASPEAPVEPTEVDQVASTAREDVPSALRSPVAEGLPPPLVDPAQILAGGPPPDGIPPVDRPSFLPTDDVDFLDDREPVIALEIGGDARAYPVQIMTWHEIVNDTVGGVPVTISYCPLCNSAVAYDRRLGERVLDFGTSGSLHNSALVMYDRQTESLWSHFTAQAIAGTLTGSELDRFPMATVAWAEWRDAHPEGLVLSRETGHDRDYGRNPYPGYDDVDRSPFFETAGDDDGRLPAMTRVVGVEGAEDAVAVQLDALLDEGMVEVGVDGRQAVVWATAGTASALDTSTVAEGRDVGTTGAFDRRLDGETLTFARDGDAFVDAQTGSRWDVLGNAVAGPLAGRRLERLVHVDTFWFAWAAFLPDTTVVPAP